MKHRALLGAFAVVVAPAVSAAEDWVGVEVTASSTAKGKADKFAPWRALDGDTSTAWCEGTLEEGAGETLTLRLSKPITVAKLHLLVGKHDSARSYKANNVVSNLAAASAEKPGDPVQQFAKSVPLTSAHDTMIKLDMKKARVVSTLELGLAGVTRGGNLKVDDTCITEVKLVDAKGEEVSLLYGVSAEAIAALPAAVTALRAAVATCDDKALARVAKFPVQHEVEAEEDSYSAKYKNAKALAKACKDESVPKLPDDVDQRVKGGQGGVTGTGLGRITIDVGSEYLERFELAWTKGAWLLVGLEGH